MPSISTGLLQSSLRRRGSREEVARPGHVLDAVDDNEPIDQDLDATPDEDEGVEEETNNRETKPEKSSSPLFQKKWLWIAIFLFLLLLNVLMLKDACGVRSIPFLYFC